MVLARGFALCADKRTVGRIGLVIAHAGAVFSTDLVRWLSVLARFLALCGARKNFLSLSLF